VHIAAAIEAMALGIHAGVDPNVLYDVICYSTGSSWILENRVPHILAGSIRHFSAVDIFVKDLGIVLGTANARRFQLPLTAAAHHVF
jgi:3-hydroxyisobutyrate dehydrogenase